MRRSRILASFVALSSVVVTLQVPLGGPAAGAPNALGVFRRSGNPATTAEFASWVPSTVTVAVDYTSRESWAAIAQPTWLTSAWRGKGYRLSLGVPMLPDSGGDLATGATGAYNAYFRQLAQLLVADGHANAILRLGWEFNGNWYRWSAATNPSAFVSYWRQIVSTMRSVPGAAFAFDWTLSLGGSFPAEQAYPGDDVVTYIGMDVYDQDWHAGYENHATRWTNLRTQPYGLDWHRAFAAAHGKQMSIPEWALSKRSDGHGGGDNPYFVDQMYSWISTNNIAYHAYFEFDVWDGELHEMMNGWFPNAAARYRSLFQGTSTTTTTAAPTTTTTTAAPATTTTTVPASSTWARRVNAGGGAFTYGATTWGTDAGYVGGRTRRVSMPISGTTFQNLYQDSRQGMTRYSFAVPSAGTYLVRLYFAETRWSTPGRRIFSVTAEGVPVVTNLDLVAAAGVNTAYEVSRQVTVSDGVVDLSFTAVADSATINAIEIVRV